MHTFGVHDPFLSSVGNNRLQGMLSTMCNERGAITYSMDDRFCIDNGAMIGYTGLLQVRNSVYSNGSKDLKQSSVTQRYRTDAVPISWRG